MLHHTRETFSSAYSFPTQGSEQTSSRLRDTAGWPITRMLLDSSHRLTPTRTRPSRDQSTRAVRAPKFLPMPKTKLTLSQKTRSSSNLHLPAALPFANPASLTQHPHQPMADLPRNGSKSTPRPRKSPRPHATTSAEPCKSSTLHLSHRPCAARHHHPADRHSRVQGMKPQRMRYRQMDTNQQRAPSRLGLLLDRPWQSVPSKNPRDQSPTTQLLELHLLPRHVHRQEVRLVQVRGCHQEAIHMVNPHSRLSLRPTQRVDSHSQRARITRSQHRTLSPNHLLEWIKAWANQAPNEYSPFSLGHLVDMQRVATSAPTPSLRLLDV
jgi:hypothetical protein